MLKSPLIRWLVALNLLVLLVWGGTWLQGLWVARTKREAQREEFRQILTKRSEMSKSDASAFQALGERVHDARRLSDSDLNTVLNNLDREYPGSPMRYSEQRNRLKTIFSLSHLLEAKMLTPSQEREIAQRLPPFPNPASLSDEGSRQVVKGIFALIRKLAVNFQDEKARTDLLGALPS